MSTASAFATLNGWCCRIRTSCVVSLLPAITVLPLAGLLPGLPLERLAIG